MNQVDRINGQNYSDNIIDPLLADDVQGGWTVTSGSGSVVMNTTYAFQGNKSLRIQNNTPTADILVSNSIQSSVINISGPYGLSLYILKTQLGETFTGMINIYQNAVLYSAQTFSLGEDAFGTDLEEVWVRFDTDIDLEFANADDITITIQLDGIPASPLVTSTIYVDGIMLYAKERLNPMPPYYGKPDFNPTLRTSDVVLENLVVGSFGLSKLSTAPSSAIDTGTLGEVRIDASYIYVCTATDVWKRVAIATW